MEKRNWLWGKWCRRVYTSTHHARLVPGPWTGEHPGHQDGLASSSALMEVTVLFWTRSFLFLWKGNFPSFPRCLSFHSSIPYFLVPKEHFFWAMSPFICGIKGNKSCKLLILEVYMREIQSLSSELWRGCQSPASAAKKGPANAVRFAPSATALSDSYGPVHIHWKLASGNDIQFDNIRCLGFLAQVRCSELIALWAEFQLWSVPWDIGCVWLRKKGKEWKLISRKVSDEQHLSLKGKMGIISLSV